MLVRYIIDETPGRLSIWLDVDGRRAAGVLVAGFVIVCIIVGSAPRTEIDSTTLLFPGILIVAVLVGLGWWVLSVLPASVVFDRELGTVVVAGNGGRGTAPVVRPLADCVGAFTEEEYRGEDGVVYRVVLRLRSGEHMQHVPLGAAYVGGRSGPDAAATIRRWVKMDVRRSSPC